MNSTQHNLTEYLRVAIEAAQLGAAQLEDWRKKFQVREKARADLVTDADNASQEVIKAHLLKNFPDHRFLGEEECVGKKIEETRPPNDGTPVWVVDPLDGTLNYVHDAPAYCVSIGLWLDNTAAVGVILDPRMKEIFTAATGLGAFLNGERIQVSSTATIGDALISTGFPANYQAQLRNVEAWRRVAFHSQSLRRTGSTALNLAYVACGRYDGYWAYDNYSWDVLGGVCLIQEAGGKASTTEGSTFDPFRMDIVASNGLIQDEILSVLKTPVA